MIHRGELIENAVRKSGYSITKIAELLGKSRRWVYLLFDNPNVPLELVNKISILLNYDFSDEIKGSVTLLKQFNESQAIYQNEQNYWKEKYYTLLEEYNDLLKKSNL